MTLGLGDGATNFVSVTNGSGALLLTGDGLAGQLAATVSVAAGTGIALERHVRGGASTRPRRR